MQSIWRRREHLGEFEHIVLLAVLRLGDDAYGVPIRLEIERANRPIADGRRVVPDPRSTRSKGYVTSWFGDPTPERGGRSRRYFQGAAARAPDAAREPRCPGRDVGRARTSGDPWLLTHACWIRVLLRSHRRSPPVRRGVRRSDGGIRRRKAEPSLAGAPDPQHVATARSRVTIDERRVARCCRTFGDDIRYALRTLRPQPGIRRRRDRADRARHRHQHGVFSILNSVALRPLPLLSRPSWSASTRTSAACRNAASTARAACSRSRSTGLSGRQQTLSGVMAYSPTLDGHLGRHSLRRRSKACWSPATISMCCGCGLVIGTGFTAANCESPNAPPAVVLSHALWTRAFAADPDIVAGRPSR